MTDETEIDQKRLEDAIKTLEILRERGGPKTPDEHKIQSQALTINYAINELLTMRKHMDVCKYVQGEQKKKAPDFDDFSTHANAVDRAHSEFENDD